MEKKKLKKIKKLEKETRILKVMFAVDGRGAKNTRMTLPITWFKDMGIDLDNRETSVTYSPRTKKITIKKKSLKEEEKD